MGPAGIKALLVEDNAADVRILREALAEVPSPRLQLVHVDRLSEALQKLNQEDHDVVLLDLSLPDSKGVDTYQKVQSSKSSVPVIVLTGLDDELLALKLVQSGAQDFLVKSQVTGELLIRSIQYAIERQRIRGRQTAEAQRRGASEELLRKGQTSHLWQSLFKILGRGAAAVLYEAGREAGVSTYDFIQTTWQPRDAGELVQAMEEHFNSAGLFGLRDLKIDRRTPRMVVRIQNSFETAQYRGQANTSVCHFLRGLFCGMGGKILEVPGLRCEETLCEGRGADSCEFLVVRG